MGRQTFVARGMQMQNVLGSDSHMQRYSVSLIDACELEVSCFILRNTARGGLLNVVFCNLQEAGVQLRLTKPPSWFSAYLHIMLVPPGLWEHLAWDSTWMTWDRNSNQSSSIQRLLKRICLGHEALLQLLVICYWLFVCMLQLRLLHLMTCCFMCYWRGSSLIT